MQEAMRFIQDNFKQVSVLKERNGGLTEMVIDAEKSIFIRKTIPYTGLPYRKMMDLSHPLLPKVYYTAEDEGRTLVIEQYVDGRNLQDILDREGPLPEAKVRHIGLQLCDALEFLHGQGIIHRDIKPSNIIIKENEVLCLIDFGAARVVKQNTDQDTHILGTPGYAPPEQYGFAATDYRSDYYALGMTLQTLLGKQYKGSLIRSVRRCVELDPEHRIQNAGELRSLLQAHWYDTFIQNKGLTTVLLCVLLGSTVWWLAIGNLTEKETAALPPALATMQEKRNNNTEQTAEMKNEKEKTETKTSNGEGANQSQKNNPEKNAQQPKEIVSKNEPVVKPPASVTSKNDSVQFNGRNWNDFEKTEQRLGPQVAGADKVVYPTGQWPQVVLTNNSDAELKNPEVVLYFTDFGVVGSNFSAEAWGGRKESITYANKDAKGVARQVTLKLSGTLLPHDSRPLSLFGGVSGFYRTGANPSVRMVFSADSAPTQEKSIAIGVK